MIDALRKLFDGAVVLYDGQKRKHHVARDAKGWFSLEATARDGKPVCHAEARINDRWTISVWSRRWLHPDAQALVKWAAGKLAAHLPGKTAEEPIVLRLGGSGGTGGASSNVVEFEPRTTIWTGRKTPTN